MSGKVKRLEKAENNQGINIKKDLESVNCVVRKLTLKYKMLNAVNCIKTAVKNLSTTENTYSSLTMHL